MAGKVEVQNVPRYAAEHRYWVAKFGDGKLWFWGAWDDKLRADSIAKDVGGIVVENEV